MGEVRGGGETLGKRECVAQYNRFWTLIDERSLFLREGDCGNCIRCFDTHQMPPPPPTGTTTTTHCHCTARVKTC